MEFREYLIALRQEKWLILGLTAGISLLTLVISWFLPPQYATRMTLVMVPRISQQLSPEGASPWLLSPEAIQSLALAQDLLQEIILQLNLRRGRRGQSTELLSVEELKRHLRVSVRPSGVQSPTGFQYPLLTLTVNGTDPQQIQRLAATWGEHVQQRLKELLASTTAQTYDFLATQADKVKRQLEAKAEERLRLARATPKDLLEGKLQALLEQYAALLKEITNREAQQQELHAWKIALKEALAPVQERGSKPLAEQLYAYLLQAEAANAQAAEAATAEGVRQLRNRLKEVQQELRAQAEQVVIARQKLEQLDQELEVLQDTYAMLFQQLQEARIATAETSEPLRVLERAIVPEEPFSPKPLLYTAIAAVLGLLISLLLVGLKFYLGTGQAEAEGESHA